MRNVLVISYLFPPSGGVGVPRAIAYSRYFPREGCRTFVLTVRKPSTAYHDPELQKLVPPEVKVYRAWNPEPPYRLKDLLWRRLAGRKRDGAGASPAGAVAALTRALKRAAVRGLFPDVQSLWYPFALRKASRIVRRHAIDTVIVIAPPYSLLRIGSALKRKFPHLTLVTDLRDDWLGYYVSQSDGPSDYSLGWSESEWAKAREIERSAFELSSIVSIATPPWVQELRQRYPDLPPAKFVCTTNGYEPQAEQLEQAGATPAAGSGTVHGKRLTIVTYFGTLNASPVYSPAAYLAALDSLPEPVRSGFETRFIGRVTPDCRPLLSGRAGVREYGFLTKQRGLDLLKEANLLLLIATNAKSHAGKLFDYLASGKPIIALSPPGGAIDQVLRETRAGWCVDPFNVTAIRDLLHMCHNRLQAGEALVSPEPGAVRRYSWPQIVRCLAENIRTAEERSCGEHPMQETAEPALLAQGNNGR
ncbi:MAG: hypothetical protein JO041_05435 [Acidobacteria bacterium]|nr:hypothetical protein [Acidobacteriota bacterium]